MNSALEAAIFKLVLGLMLILVVVWLSVPLLAISAAGGITKAAYRSRNDIFINISWGVWVIALLFAAGWYLGWFF